MVLHMAGYIDFHCHLGFVDGEYCSSGKLLNSLDRNGVEKAIVSASPRCEDQTISEGNNKVIEAVQQHPERLVGFAYVDPTVECGAVEEIKRSTDAGLRGVKLAPDTHGFCAAPGLLWRALEYAAAQNLPVAIHCNPNECSLFDRLKEIISAFPDTLFMLSSKGDGCVRQESVNASVLNGNVMFETGNLAPRTILRLTDTLGAERVMFGSSFPYASIRYELAKVKALVRERPELEGMMAGTPERLFRRITNGSPGPACGDQISSEISSARAE